MRPLPLLLLVALAAMPPVSAEPVASRTFRFVYRASTKEIPAGAKIARLWVPVPTDLEEQKISDGILRLTSGSHTVDVELEDAESVKKVGDVATRVALRPIAHGGGRTLCVETDGMPIALELSFDVTRREVRAVKAPSEPGHYLAAEAMIPLDRKVAQIANGLPTKATVRETARALYDHVLGEMNYGKPEGVPWGRGDAEWACDSKVGNCTDFHSYFIGLARTKKIPARFEMGFSIPGGEEKEAKVGGYHCWAYFFEEGTGWVPVDISEADKNPEKAEYFFGALDSDRFTMTFGRDLVLDPKPACGTINFLVYPYCEVDGKEHKGVDRSFARLVR